MDTSGSANRPCRLLQATSGAAILCHHPAYLVQLLWYQLAEILCHHPAYLMQLLWYQLALGLFRSLVVLWLDGHKWLRQPTVQASSGHFGRCDPVSPPCIPSAAAVVTSGAACVTTLHT